MFRLPSVGHGPVYFRSLDVDDFSEYEALVNAALPDVGAAGIGGPGVHPDAIRLWVNDAAKLGEIIDKLKQVPGFGPYAPARLGDPPATAAYRYSYNDRPVVFCIDSNTPVDVP